MNVKSEIALLGEPVLRQIAELIDDVTHPDVQQLAQTMLFTLEGSNGVGLAAPHIFESKRIIITILPRIYQDSLTSLGRAVKRLPTFDIDISN